MPLDFLQKKFYKNTLEDWLLAFGIVVLTILLARVIYWLFSKALRTITKNTATEVDDQVLAQIDTPIILGIILVGFRLAIEQLTFSRPVETYLQRGFVFMTALAITWFLTRVIRVFVEQYFKKNAVQDPNPHDMQMIGLAKRASVIILWLIGVVVGLNNAGFDVGALIAGLGIGGVALALAAQDTVKNIIGGIIVFLDKPFYVGDTIKVKDIEGTIVYTGIRSTRIRTGAGRLVTIPNAQFTDSSIENITLEPSKRIVTYLSILYETPIEKIDEAIAILRDIATNTKAISLQKPIVFLERFNQSSIDINFTYYIRKQGDIYEAQTEVNKQVLKRFATAGIEFAYPTQTSYSKGGDNAEKQPKPANDGDKAS